MFPTFVSQHSSSQLALAAQLASYPPPRGIQLQARRSSTSSLTEEPIARRKPPSHDGSDVIQTKKQNKTRLYIVFTLKLLCHSETMITYYTCVDVWWITTLKVITVRQKWLNMWCRIGREEGALQICKVILYSQNDIDLALENALTVLINNE